MSQELKINLKKFSYLLSTGFPPTKENRSAAQLNYVVNKIIKIYISKSLFEHE